MEQERLKITSVLDSVRDNVISCFTRCFHYKWGMKKYLLNKIKIPAEVVDDVFRDESLTKHGLGQQIFDTVGENLKRRIILNFYNMEKIPDEESVNNKNAAYGALDDLRKKCEELGIVPLSKADTAQIKLTNDQYALCIKEASQLVEKIKDRGDLHTRDYLEKYLNILQGELAETIVLKWLLSHGINCSSAVDKKSDLPDPGHDINIVKKDGTILKCSVKSSLSVKKSSIEDIIKEFTIATKESELRDINIQVYFWYDLQGEHTDGKHRITVMNVYNSAIIGWAKKEDLEQFGSYTTEGRKSPITKLYEVRGLPELIEFIN